MIRRRTLFLENELQRSTDMARTRFLIMISALLAACLVLPGQAVAKDDYRGGQEEEHNWSLAIGGGLVRPEDGETEPYLTASVRIPIGNNHNRKGGGLRGYLEPEIGYWELSRGFGSDDREDAEMLNIGVNLLGVASTRGVDYWIGVGFGFYDESRTIEGGGVGTVFDESGSNFGGNLQVGVDVNIGQRLALFGAGRLDLVDSDFFDTQLKIYGGLRFRF